LRPHINWQFLAYIILTLGEAMVSITGLEFSYTQAPNTMKSSVMALWLLTVASGELFVGLVNKWILGAGPAHKLSDYQYFTFFTWLMFGAAVVFVVVACFYKGRTHLQSQQLTRMKSRRADFTRRHAELNSMRITIAAAFVLSSLTLSVFGTTQDDAFQKIARDYIEQYLRANPEDATELGDHRFDGQLTDYSSEAQAKELATQKEFRDKLNAIDGSQLTGANNIDFRILKREH
jgi:hypothetical protein